MRRLLAAILRLTADHLDPAPPPEPCPLMHYPVQPYVYPSYPSQPWITYGTEWSCQANTETDPNIVAYN